MFYLSSSEYEDKYNICILLLVVKYNKICQVKSKCNTYRINFSFKLHMDIVSDSESLEVFQLRDVLYCNSISSLDGGKMFATRRP